MVVRRVLVLACLGSSGCLAFWSPCKPDDDSLIADGEFDSLQCWEDLDGTWTSDVTLDDEEGRPGSAPSLRVENPFPDSDFDSISVVQRGGNTLMRDTLYVEDGRNLTVRLWARASQAGRRFQLTLRERDGTAELGRFEAAAGASWGEHVFEVTGTPEGDLALQLGVGGPDEATLWLDDVTLTAVEVEAD